MATVPVRQDGLTPTGKILSASINAGNSSFGGGAGNVAEATDRLLSVAGQIAEKETQRADEIAFMDMDTEAARQASDIELKVRSLKGRDAFGAPDVVDQEWTRVAADLEKRAVGRGQRDMLNRALQVRRQRLDQEVNTHMAAESERYDDEATAASLEVSREEAALHYGNPNRVREAIEQQLLARQAYAERKGMPPEWVESKFKSDRSATHRSVIMRMLSDAGTAGSEEMFQRAEQYAKAVSKEIIERDLGAIDAARMAAQKTKDKVIDAAKSARYMAAVRGEMKPEQADELVESLQIEPTEHRTLLEAMAKTYEDPRIDPAKRSDALIEIFNDFVELGGAVSGGQPSEEIPEEVDGWLWFNSPQKKEKIEAFRTKLHANAGSMSRDQHLKFMQFTERANDAAVPVDAAKMTMFSTFREKMARLDRNAFSATVTPLLDGLLDESVNTDQFMQQIAQAELNAVVRKNPLRTKYPIGYIDTNPQGIQGEVYAYDEMGNPKWGPVRGPKK